MVIPPPSLILLIRLYSYKFNTHLEKKLPTRDYTPEGCEFYYFPLHLAKPFLVLARTSILYLQHSCLNWNKGISFWAVTLQGFVVRCITGAIHSSMLSECRVQQDASHTQSKIYELPYITSSQSKEHQPIHLAFISQYQGWHSRCLYDLMFLFSFSKLKKPCTVLGQGPRYPTKQALTSTLGLL